MNQIYFVMTQIHQWRRYGLVDLLMYWFKLIMCSSRKYNLSIFPPYKEQKFPGWVRGSLRQKHLKKCIRLNINRYFLELNNISVPVKRQNRQVNWLFLAHHGLSITYYLKPHYFKLFAFSLQLHSHVLLTVLHKYKNWSQDFSKITESSILFFFA